MFLFACFGATRSSLGDAFLMIRERRDVPCGFWGWSFATRQTVSWTINQPPTYPIWPRANDITSTLSVFIAEKKKLQRTQHLSDTMFSAFAKLVFRKVLTAAPSPCACLWVRNKIEICWYKQNQPYKPFLSLSKIILGFCASFTAVQITQTSYYDS